MKSVCLPYPPRKQQKEPISTDNGAGTCRVPSCILLHSTVHGLGVTPLIKGQTSSKAGELCSALETPPGEQSGAGNSLGSIQKGRESSEKMVCCAPKPITFHGLLWTCHEDLLPFPMALAFTAMAWSLHSQVNQASETPEGPPCRSGHLHKPGSSLGMRIISSLWDPSSPTCLQGIYFYCAPSVLIVKSHYQLPSTLQTFTHIFHLSGLLQSYPDLSEPRGRFSIPRIMPNPQARVRSSPQPFQNWSSTGTGSEYPQLLPYP